MGHPSRFVNWGLMATLVSPVLAAFMMRTDRVNRATNLAAENIIRQVGGEKSIRTPLAIEAASRMGRTKNPSDILFALFINSG